jgi:drug/metabolite transporter (DMT)-like permease
MFCGLIIAAASTFQQLGLLKVSAGKTGFLTALYILMVPLLGIFFKRRTSMVLWGAVFMALGGAYLLCGGSGKVGIGEVCVIICALLFAVHILVIDHYVARCDCVRLSCLQFAFAAAASAAASLAFREPWIFDEIIKSLPFWGFCGIGSSAIAFTLQMFAQKYLHPVTAALIMSLESVFAALCGWLLLNERMSKYEITGCILVFAAVILSQIPIKKSHD